LVDGRCNVEVGNPAGGTLRWELSHSCLLMFAIMLEPAQTPLPSVGTQLPPRENWPLPHWTQSFDVAPVQVEQEEEQG